VPLGKLTVLDGDPGLGKSTLTLGMAAALSRGTGLPGGSDLQGPADVVIVSLEDGVADTIRPRLEAADGDLARIHVITSIGPEQRIPSVPDDLGEMEPVIAERGVKLVILDPLMGALSAGVNAHRDQDVRRALAPLAAMAQRTGAAIVIVRHLNKAEEKSAIYRGGGSIGIIGAARVGLLVARDPDATSPDDPRRVLAVAKCNLARESRALRFSLGLVPIFRPAKRGLRRTGRSQESWRRSSRSESQLCDSA
jgi:RecA-family ATPase